MYVTVVWWVFVAYPECVCEWRVFVVWGVCACVWNVGLWGVFVCVGGLCVRCVSLCGV